MVLKKSEIFLSLQGEGLYQNEPTVFVRTQGCNLIPSCQYCDTAFAQDGSKGEEISVEEVVREVNTLLPNYKGWVCITGGEPLQQVNEVEQLVRELKKVGYRITIETNGSFPPPRWYTLVDSWSTDIKCPSSGVCGVSLRDWWKTRYTDQIKLVVGTKEDLEFAQREITNHITKSPRVLISPIMKIKDTTKGRTVINLPFLQEVWEFCVANRVRWSLQQHKIVFGNRKGV